MKVIYTSHFPPGDFHGINLFGIVFVQRRWGKMGVEELNHELIHTLQQWEMGFVLFYVWYGVEWLVRLVMYRFDAERAYYNIGFEREAYAHERDFSYRRRRRLYAWWEYMRRGRGEGGGRSTPDGGGRKRRRRRRGRSTLDTGRKDMEGEKGGMERGKSGEKNGEESFFCVIFLFIRHFVLTLHSLLGGDACWRFFFRGCTFVCI